MRFSCGLVPVVCLALSCVGLVAQDEAPPKVSAISVEAKLVVIPTVVRDKKGALVGSLTKADFSLQVGGKDQVIRYFDKVTDVPLTVGLLVDVSRGQQSYLEEERAGSKTFLASGLKPAATGRVADTAFVVHFAHQIELLQDVTNQQPKLEKSLRLLGTESASFTSHTQDGGEDSEGRTIRGKGTSLYDAIFVASDEVMSKQKERKVLVVMTDGIDAGSKESLNDAIEMAQRNDVIVYAMYYRSKDEVPHREDKRSGGGSNPGGSSGPRIGFPGSYPSGGGYPGSPGTGSGGNNPNGSGKPGGTSVPKPNVDGKQVLERICGETGGRVFEVGKRMSLDEAFGLIAEDLRNAYRIGFTPDAEAASTKRGGYHMIDMRLTGANAKAKMDVQCRDGYFVGQ